MKPRRVVVTMEIESNIPIKDLRKKEYWQIDMATDDKLLQVQANVIKPEKVKK